MATRKRKAIRAAKRAHAEISNTSNTNIEENTNEAAAAVAAAAEVAVAAASAAGAAEAVAAALGEENTDEAAAAAGGAAAVATAAEVAVVAASAAGEVAMVVSATVAAAAGEGEGKNNLTKAAKDKIGAAAALKKSPLNSYYLFLISPPPMTKRLTRSIHSLPSIFHKQRNALSGQERSTSTPVG
jgi:hypothetical protein